MIFGWYLVGGCISGQRCVVRNKRVDATFDLDPVTLEPKFCSALHLLNEWWFLGGGCIKEQRCVVWKEYLCRCDLWPWPCDFETEIPFRSVSPRRMKIFGWYLVGGCIGGQRCVPRNIRVDVTFDLETKIAVASVSPKRIKICFYWYLVGGCIRGCVAWKICVDVTFDLDPVIFKLKLPSTPYITLIMNEDFWLIFCEMMSPALISCLNFTLHYEYLPVPRIMSGSGSAFLRSCSNV
jgi:hypothetical protein